MFTRRTRPTPRGAVLRRERAGFPVCTTTNWWCSPATSDSQKQTSNSHRRKKPQKGEEPPSTALHSTHHIMHTFNAHAHTKTLFFGRVTPAILHLTCGALPPSTRPQGSSNCAAFVGMPRPALGKKPVLSRIFPMRRHSHIADTYSHPWVEKWWKWVLCVVASPC